MIQDKIRKIKMTPVTHIVTIAPARHRGRNGSLTKINAYTFTVTDSAGNTVSGEAEEPLGAAARTLLDRGIAQPTDQICISRDGVACDLSANVKWAAEHTVSETDTHGPSFVKWRPFNKAVFG
jgi:hypothetical protein